MNDIAEPSASSSSSPRVLVAKPDQTNNICTDFRNDNYEIKPDCYPLPRLDDCIDRVGSVRFVTKLDLLKGYSPFRLAVHVHVQQVPNWMGQMERVILCDL